ncbi:hypothetical protein QP916_03635 [Corynebacterium accolens]|nr:hypothetical protein [Corynebacterium accolens]MDK8497757.1 hypothetical protein [Corynebacterium accolens]
MTVGTSHNGIKNQKGADDTPGDAAREGGQAREHDYERHHFFSSLISS